MSFIRRTSSNKGCRSNGLVKGKMKRAGRPFAQSFRGRSLRIEPLEDRQLLSVATAPVVPSASAGYAHFVATGQDWSALGENGSKVVASGDLNGDGKPDVIVRDLATNSCQLWLNDGTGHFTDSGQTLGVTGGDVVAGDLNGDGHLDLFFGNTVLLNDGTGHFHDTNQSIDIGSGVSLGDVNGDGSLDAVGQSLWLNDGTGHFTKSRQALPSGSDVFLQFVDLNGDGKLDIYGAGGAWLNDGQGNFSNGGQLFGVGGTNVVFGDLNGDGLVDAVVGVGIAPAYRSAEVWLQDANHNFYDGRVGFNNDQITLADVNGDGVPDVVMLSSDGQSVPEVFLNDGQGHFSQGEPIVACPGALSFVTGDFDGNGSTDLICNYSFRASPETLLSGGKVMLNLPDTMPPTVTIDHASTQTNPTNETSIDFTAVFSKPVTDFRQAM